MRIAGRRGTKMRAQIINRRGGNGTPSDKSHGQPKSERIPGRRKSWLSLVEKVDSKGNDAGARSGLPWWKSPLMKSERLTKAATRK